jgi:hypothetical protein
MISHHFSLICKHAVIDENSKSISIFDVIEQIIVFAEPDQTVNIPMQFEIFSLWMRSVLDTPAKGVSRISLNDPNGVSKKHIEVNIELTEATFFRSIIKVSAIELRGPGKYNFIIELKQKDEKWKKMSSIPFVVTYKPPKIIEKELEIKDE